MTDILMDEPSKSSLERMNFPPVRWMTLSDLSSGRFYVPILTDVKMESRYDGINTTFDIIDFRALTNNSRLTEHTPEESFGISLGEFLNPDPADYEKWNRFSSFIQRFIRPIAQESPAVMDRIIDIIKRGSRDGKIPLIINAHGFARNETLYLSPDRNTSNRYMKAEKFLKQIPDILLLTKPLITGSATDKFSIFKERYSCIIFVACGGSVRWDKELVDSIGIPIIHAKTLAGGNEMFEGPLRREAVIFPEMAEEFEGEYSV